MVNTDNWESIGKVSGVGNSTEKINYSFNDNSLVNAYYRLKQVDIDGAITLSKAILIDASNCAEDELMIYPNPANDMITVSTNNPTKQDVLIYDCMGRLVKTLTLETEHQVDVSSWSEGMYLIKMGNEVQSFVVY